MYNIEELKIRLLSELKEIAEETGSPIAFTAKILQQLAKNNIIKSIKGPFGGFEIEADKVDSISLSHIVTAIDGNKIYVGCGLGLKKCSEKEPCPVHEKFKKIREELREMLENTSLRELSLGLKTGLTFLKCQVN